MSQVTIRRPLGELDFGRPAQVLGLNADDNNRRLHLIDGEFSSILASPRGYLITLSARASTFGEIVTPIC